ncbi:MAG TPA: hypothetical protein VGV38_14805 [Pyrinomonadaceae bacterium]|nr:hypothetical protein [Pyrinomonadaceae bacterium]
MSEGEQEQIRSLAGRIARRLSEGDAAGRGDAGEVARLRAALEEVRRRLAHVESHIAHDDSCPAETEGAGEGSRGGRAGDGSTPATQFTPTRSPWLSGTYVPATSHPSQERFGITEAVSELVDYFEREKVCNVEPGGKPCDHCGMCSSRGF